MCDIKHTKMIFKRADCSATPLFLDNFIKAQRSRDLRYCKYDLLFQQWFASGYS